MVMAMKWMMLILPTDAIAQGEKGGIDGGNGDGGLEEGGEEDGVVEMDEDVADFLIVNDSSGLILVPCDGYRKGVIGAHRCSRYSTHMHVFCGDA